MPVFLLLVAIILNSLANILLKIGARSGLNLQGFNLIYLIKENWIALIGLVLFAFSAGCYLMVLKTVPVSVAYPVMVIVSFIIVNFTAYFYLREQITLLQLLGYSFLVLGVSFIYYFKK